MKNVFYFMLKAFLFLRYLNFCHDFFGHVGKQLDKKLKLISKSVASQPITIHILPNISRSKGNQTIKFGQLIQET